MANITLFIEAFTLLIHMELKSGTIFQLTMVLLLMDVEELKSETM